MPDNWFSLLKQKSKAKTRGLTIAEHDETVGALFNLKLALLKCHYILGGITDFMGQEGLFIKEISLVLDLRQGQVQSKAFD